VASARDMEIGSRIICESLVNSGKCITSGSRLSLGQLHICTYFLIQSKVSRYSMVPVLHSSENTFMVV
jgi:hypothetical protein